MIVKEDKTGDEENRKSLDFLRVGTVGEGGLERWANTWYCAQLNSLSQSHNISTFVPSLTLMKDFIHLPLQLGKVKMKICNRDIRLDGSLVCTNEYLGGFVIARELSATEIRAIWMISNQDIKLVAKPGLAALCSQQWMMEEPTEAGTACCKIIH